MTLLIKITNRSSTQYNPFNLRVNQNETVYVQAARIGVTTDANGRIISLKDADGSAGPSSIPGTGVVVEYGVLTDSGRFIAHLSNIKSIS